MNWLDLDEVQYSVDEYHKEVSAHFLEGQAMQMYLAEKIGYFFSWAGAHLLEWGEKLQTTSPEFPLQSPSQ